MELVGIGVSDELGRRYEAWVDEILRSGESIRESKWTESVAVGNTQFIGKVRGESGTRAAGRDIIKSGAGYELKESGVSYNCDFEVKNGTLSPENTHFWELLFITSSYMAWSDYSIHNRKNHHFEATKKRN